MKLLNPVERKEREMYIQMSLSRNDELHTLSATIVNRKSNATR